MGWLSRAPGRRGRIICCLLLRPVDHSSAWQRNLHPRSYVAPSAFTRSSVASTVAVFALTGYLRRVKVILPVTSVISNPTDSSIQEALVQFNALPVGQGHRLRHEYAIASSLPRPLSTPDRLRARHSFARPTSLRRPPSGPARACARKTRRPRRECVQPIGCTRSRTSHRCGEGGGVELERRSHLGLWTDGTRWGHSSHHSTLPACGTYKQCGHWGWRVF
ncbi:hypothetical protein BD310DRAFT_918574 [Dichomitus squalens]|uniref:Uncharacterized protein n=1 Tax=Dichomitus squalens TaxID=114155 RepID=A0A4Q9Q566_9APHY|nr:hypothetical protein BD310DRAFT_918574 [Dichomitus squalens]